MVNEIIFTISRIIAGLMFILFGANHFMEFEQMSGYAKMKGIPLPKIAVAGTGILLVFGGLSILLGFFPVIGLLGLAIFFIGVTPLMHDFWRIEDEQQKQVQMTNFLKNIALLGLILILIAYSIDSTWPLAIAQ